MESEKTQSINPNNESTEKERKSGKVTLGVVGGACCIAPLAVAGFVGVPVLGALGGVGLFLALVYRSLRSIFTKYKFSS